MKITDMKIHPAPGVPQKDQIVYRAVRQTVGDEMVLMVDPTHEPAIMLRPCGWADGGDTKVYRTACKQFPFIKLL